MVLTYAHLPDFAAGLDHIPGRGRQVSDGAGGYWIDDIDEPVPGNAYVLRPGLGPGRPPAPRGRRRSSRSPPPRRAPASGSHSTEDPE